MITDLQMQHELLKTALEATDNYLGVEKKAKDAGAATNVMVHDFSYFMAQAHEALQALGVLDQHEPYMEKHVQEMLKLHGHKDKTIEDLPYAHVANADFGEVEESNIKTNRLSFTEYLNESNKVELTDDEIQNIVDSVEWEDMVDLYEDDELIYEELIQEKISPQARLRKRQAFSRMRSKRNIAKGIKLKRASTPDVLKKRAVIAARNALYRRLLHGRNKAKLSAAEKDRMEQQVKRLKSIQSSLVPRLLPKMRSIEQKRLASYRAGKK